MKKVVDPDIRQMECDILEAVKTLGHIRPGAPATDFLMDKYGKSKEQEITVLVSYLVEERFLFPFFSPEGEEFKIHARGITPKGANRLRELQHPVRTWVGANWFAVVIASITAVIGIATIATNALIRSN